MIVGAYEIKPGIMHVELLNTQTETVEELYVYTEDYWYAMSMEQRSSRSNEIKTFELTRNKHCPPLLTKVNFDIPGTETSR